MNLIKDLKAFGRWFVNKIEDVPMWLTHALTLLAKKIPPKVLAQATQHAEHILNDYIVRNGTPLAELALTEAEHTTLFVDVVAAVKVFDPGLNLPDVHTLAALAISYAMSGVSFAEAEFNKLETAITSEVVHEQ